MSELLSAVGGGAVGLAMGEAGATVLEPALEAPRQEAWKASQAKVLELGQLASLVAQALNAIEDVTEDAARNGFDPDQLRSAIQLALKAPGPPDAEKLYLRSNGKYPGAISLDLLHHAYAKAGLEGQWWEALTDAAGTVLLTPDVLALGAVRGTLNDQGLLVVELDTSDSNVQRYTPAALNIIDEAAAQGISQDRLRAMIGNVGLPMAVELAARATFREIITKGAYYQAVLEGDTRPEWADSIFEVAREILTSHDYVEGYLRGWLPTTDEMYAATALHGMSEADTDLLYKISGRPLAIHQITTGLARGGTFGGFYDGVPEPYLSAVRESNIRPEYGNLDYANRYTYPSGFQIKAEATGGNLTADQTEQLLLEIGWSPEWAAFFADKWTGATGATSSHVKSAQTAVVTAAKKAFLATTLTPEDATSKLEAAGLSAADAASIIAQWQLIAQIEGAQIDTAGGTPT